MAEPDNNKDVALKAWDIYQALAKGMGDSAWKIRSVALSISGALVAYSYSEQSPVIYLVVSILAVLFCLLESGYRRLQDQYIKKSLEIERTLNDFVANEKLPRFPDSIGTDLSTPSLRQLLSLFQAKRVLFWLPYLVMVVGPALLWFLGVQKAAK